MTRQDQAKTYDAQLQLIEALSQRVPDKVADALDRQWRRYNAVADVVPTLSLRPPAMPNLRVHQVQKPLKKPAAARGK